MLPLIDWLLFSRTVELLFEFEEVSNDMSFDFFKKKLIDFFKKSDYFYNLGTRQDLIKKVAEANSHHEFVEIFKFIHWSPSMSLDCSALKVEKIKNAESFTDSTVL